MTSIPRPLLLVLQEKEKQGAVLDAESSNLDGISSNVASAYQKALEMCNARAHLEEQISRQDLSDSEKFQQYMYEQSSGDPGRVQLLYERAITDFPVSSDLWLDYTRYLDKTLKVGNVVRDVYSRATKNCPWVGELWVRSLLSLECGRAYEEEISTVFGKSLRCAFSTFEEYLDVLLARIDGLRRRILFSSEVEGALDYSLIRETFQLLDDTFKIQDICCFVYGYQVQLWHIDLMPASDGLFWMVDFNPLLLFLGSCLSLRTFLARDRADWLCIRLLVRTDEEYQRFAAFVCLLVRLEQSMGKDTRSIWERLLKICGTMLEAWQSYISMEIELGHTGTGSGNHSGQMPCLAAI
ncbi:EMBRYO DEFECTIVE 140 [Citrus sinensis]|uniref:EMBRYO DEFECTIVE 140 n=1 Tax=Citrus sinensis TaxID=2711 RepID=A0ACB8K638_CITSI|nr:EMBRYO DEFECTIVE 140 [Citrus sinensis]